MLVHDVLPCINAIFLSQQPVKSQVDTPAFPQLFYLHQEFHRYNLCSPLFSKLNSVNEVVETELQTCHTRVNVMNHKQYVQIQLRRSPQKPATFSRVFLSLLIILHVGSTYFDTTNPMLLNLQKILHSRLHQVTGSAFKLFQMHITYILVCWVGSDSETGSVLSAEHSPLV